MEWGEPLAHTWHATPSLPHFPTCNQGTLSYLVVVNVQGCPLGGVHGTILAFLIYVKVLYVVLGALLGPAPKGGSACNVSHLRA